MGPKGLTHLADVKAWLPGAFPGHVPTVLLAFGPQDSDPQEPENEKVWAGPLSSRTQLPLASSTALGCWVREEQPMPGGRPP